MDEADLKPHKSVYWLNSHDPDFDEKAREICQLYVDAPKLYQQGRLVICSDEKTGMQILERKYPTRPVEPGKPERREHEYIRHGARALIGSFAVPTGEVVWDLGLTRTSDDFAAHMAKVAERFAEMERFDWILDNLNTHWSLPVCQLVAELSDVPFVPRELRTGKERRAFLTDPSHKHVFHFTPKHGSWLNQVELWFGVLARRFLARGNFCSAEDFESRFRQFLDDYNLNWAHPYRWTYTGQPLVRDTPFSKTRRQQKRGRACFSPRPPKRAKWGQTCRSNTLSLGVIPDLRRGSLAGSAQSNPEKESSPFRSAVQMARFPQLARLRSRIHRPGWRHSPQPALSCCYTRAFPPHGGACRCRICDIVSDPARWCAREDMHPVDRRPGQHLCNL